MNQEQRIIRDWLEKFELEEFEETLFKNGFTKINAILGLDKDFLSQMGIVSLGKQAEFLTAIEFLRQSESSQQGRSFSATCVSGQQELDDQSGAEFFSDVGSVNVAFYRDGFDAKLEQQAVAFTWREGCVDKKYGYTDIVQEFGGCAPPGMTLVTTNARRQIARLDRLDTLNQIFGLRVSASGKVSDISFVTPIEDPTQAGDAQVYVRRKKLFVIEGIGLEIKPNADVLRKQEEERERRNAEGGDAVMPLVANVTKKKRRLEEMQDRDGLAAGDTAKFIDESPPIKKRRTQESRNESDIFDNGLSRSEVKALLTAAVEEALASSDGEDSDCDFEDMDDVQPFVCGVYDSSVVRELYDQQALAQNLRRSDGVFGCSAWRRAVNSLFLYAALSPDKPSVVFLTDVDARSPITVFWMSLVATKPMICATHLELKCLKTVLAAVTRRTYDHFPEDARPTSLNDICKRQR